MVEMQERVMCQVGGSAQGVPAAQELGAAHREQLLGAESRNVEPRRRAVAVPDRDIDILAREIDVVKRGAYPEIDRWVGLGKAAKAMHEPLRREVGGRTDGEDPRTLPLEQTVGSGGDAIQCIAHHTKIVASRLGDDEPLRLAIEELEAQLCLERFHLMADSPLCNAELFGRARKALVPGGSLEGLERIQGRQSARHHKRPLV